MAFTKLYVTNKTAPYMPATIRGTWSDTAAAITKALDTVKDQNGLITSVARAETSSSNTFDVLLYRGVSGPLKAQTISGTVNLILGILENSASADFVFKLHIYVTQGDTDTPRGTLLSNYVDPSSKEWPTTATGKTLNAAQTLSSLAISDNDRLVVEIGFRALNTLTSSFTGTLRYGTLDPNDGHIVSDLTDGSTAVTTLAGTINFSNSIDEIVLTTRISDVPVESALQETTITTRISDLPIEAARKGTNIETRISDDPIEVARKGTNIETRISDDPIEVARQGTSIEARVSDFNVEVAGTNLFSGVNTIISDENAEIARRGTVIEADISLFCVEVAMANEAVSTGQQQNVFVVT